MWECKAPAKRSQHCWPSVCKPLPNGVKALGTRFYNIVRRKKGATSWARLATLIGRVATCWVLKNRGNAYAQAQHYCTNLAKQLYHHHTISTNVAWKILPFSNFIHRHPTCRNTSQQNGQTQATCCAQQCCVHLNVAIVWAGFKTFCGFVQTSCGVHLLDGSKILVSTGNSS